MMSVQAVMRFPRSNLNHSINTIEERGPRPAVAEPGDARDMVPLTADQKAVMGHNADQFAANAIEGRDDMPLWQKAFTLGPNVRFTRTPQNLVAGKQVAGGAPGKADDEAVGSVAVEVPAVGQERILLRDVGTGAGASTRRPLGVAVVGGLAFSQLVTLYVTPVFYTYLDELQQRFSRRRDVARPVVGWETAD